MLHRPDSGPSQNNSRKCQTSDGEMRPGEVSSAFCGPPSPSPSSAARLHTQPDRMRTSRRRSLLLQKKKKSTMLFICVPAVHLHTASRSIFLVMRGDKRCHQRGHGTDTFAALEYPVTQTEKHRHNR